MIVSCRIAGCRGMTGALGAPICERHKQIIGNALVARLERAITEHAFGPSTTDPNAPHVAEWREAWAAVRAKVREAEG